MCARCTCVSVSVYVCIAWLSVHKYSFAFREKTFGGGLTRWP